MAVAWWGLQAESWNNDAPDKTAVIDAGFVFLTKIPSGAFCPAPRRNQYLESTLEVSVLFYY
jgi:hypothetical protein